MTAKLAGRRGAGAGARPARDPLAPSVGPRGWMRQFAAASPERAPPSALLDLQQAIGNRSFNQLVHRPEAEAEQTAARVVGGPPRAVEEADGAPVPAELQQSIQAARVGGQSLPMETRGTMERELGTNLGGVRLHADARASELSESLDARAFTVGRDIYFRRGEYNRGTGEGQRLLAHELTHVAQQSAMPGGAGAVQCARGPKKWPKKITVAGERVLVKNKTEEKKARALIPAIKRKYGITVNSTAGLNAIIAQYTNVPALVTGTLKTRTWPFKVLQGLANALGFYAPILGKRRATSSRSAVGQEVTTVSFLKEAIDTNTVGGQLDPDTYGEYFRGSTNFSLFKSSETNEDDFPGDVPAQIEGTSIHEMAHGLFHYKLADFVLNTPYWAAANLKSGLVGAEAPPTLYGQKNASEDLSETVMLYFKDRTRLQGVCPQRDALIHGWVTGW